MRNPVPGALVALPGARGTGCGEPALVVEAAGVDTGEYARALGERSAYPTGLTRTSPHREVGMDYEMSEKDLASAAFADPPRDIP